MKRLGCFLLFFFFLLTSSVTKAQNGSWDAFSILSYNGYDFNSKTYSITIKNKQDCKVTYDIEIFLNPKVLDSVSIDGNGKKTLTFCLPYGAEKIAIKPREKCSNLKDTLCWLEVNIACCVLSVDFGEVKAKVDGDNVVVNWKTFTESNNDHFIILGSADGKTFKQIAEVKSKAVNGNSSASIDYSTSIPLSGIALGGATFFALIGFTVKNKRKRLLLSIIYLFALAVFFSCKKEIISPIKNNTDIKVIQVAQVDKDNLSKTVSPVIRVQK